MRSAIVAILGAVAAALLSVHSIHAYPQVRWRTQLVHLKATGRLPEVSWYRLLRGLPSRFPRLNRQGWATGFVTIERADLGGACPVAWTSPLGRFRGNLEDENDLEFYSSKYMHLLDETADGVLPTIEPGDVVLEIGGWIGAFSRVALRAGASKLIVFEPHPTNIECFRLNFAEEIAAGRVVLVEAAAWKEPGEVEMRREAPFNLDNSTKGYNIVDNGEIRVRATTVDEELRRLNVERVDLMNLDVEGAESEALLGARDTIRRHRPRIVACIHHWPGDDEKVLGAVRSIRPDYRLRTNRLHALFY